LIAVLERVMRGSGPVDMVDHACGGWKSCLRRMEIMLAEDGEPFLYLFANMVAVFVGFFFCPYVLPFFWKKIETAN
jgi:hypothetical protein